MIGREYERFKKKIKKDMKGVYIYWFMYREKSLSNSLIYTKGESEKGKEKQCLCRNI